MGNSSSRLVSKAGTGSQPVLTIEWDNDALPLPEMIRGDSIFLELFAALRLGPEEQPRRVAELIAGPDLGGDKGFAIIAIALGKVMCTRQYRPVLSLVVKTLATVWKSKTRRIHEDEDEQESDPPDDEEPTEEEDFVLDGLVVPECVKSFADFGHTLAEGCKIFGIPLDKAEFLKAKDLSNGLLEGEMFDYGIVRCAIQARVKWLCNQFEEMPAKSGTEHAALDILRCFTTEEARFKIPARSDDIVLDSRWLFLYLFVSTALEEHCGKNKGFLNSPNHIRAIMERFHESMLERKTEMSMSFERSSSYWHWSEDLNSIQGVEWDDYSEMEKGTDEAVILLNDVFSHFHHDGEPMDCLSNVRSRLSRQNSRESV